MERVVIVGAGLYGLIAAKTCLQVKGVYDGVEQAKETSTSVEEIPSCFTDTRQTSTRKDGCSLLVIDSASDIGGTWAQERLYPNLLSQNSYGSYEFSDLPLVDVVSPDPEGSGKQFIAGWKINRYLHAWCDKWNLKGHIRLNWRVDSIRRLKSREWQLNISITSDENRKVSLVCDKLILATGLTSVPNFPQIATSPPGNQRADSIIHAKDIGSWARHNLGYDPVPQKHACKSHTSQQASTSSKPPKSVVIYGGAKSSFDLVHFFAKLHQSDPRMHLNVKISDPIQVHWVIREEGTGPSWMAPPMSTLPNGEVVPSDKAASTRLIHYLDPFCSEIPKRIVLCKPADGPFWKLRLEGSWWARFIHGNPLGRWFIRRFWSAFDRQLVETANYSKDSKIEMLRPDHSVISCNSTLGIANQGDLWDTIRYKHVSIHRSTVQSISSTADAENIKANHGMRVDLVDGDCLENIDLAVYATGYKLITPTKFEPKLLRLQLGISDLIDPRNNEEVTGHGEEDVLLTDHTQHWDAVEQRSKTRIANVLTANGCSLDNCETPSKIGECQVVPYRLFRRMVAPELVAEGDRSFAALGIILTSTIAVVAEVQALWVAAFLTGGLDETISPTQAGSLSLDLLSRETLEESIAADNALGSVTGSGLQVDAVHYNDILMRDLGLNPHRLGGGRWRELTGVYEPSVYAGIVEEWRDMNK